MVGAVLDTKVRLPRRRPGWIARPRLTERLGGEVSAALTVVSAPPGFGKTTMLAEWLAVPTAYGRTAAWLSLDERDNDPAVFWTYLVSAVRTAHPAVGADALSILQSPHPMMEAVVTSLINGCAEVANDLVLVLDDYHVITNRDVHDQLAFLLDHRPERLHLVIAARADPPLQLARLRARGELTEIRAMDLRFTSDEAATYLNRTMGLALTADDVAALEARTEGWIAALQLAALSIRGRADVAGFISDFAGDDRYIVDYLAEEVLNRQSADVRQFLMHTSILDRLSGPLCDAVTELGGGREALPALERENLFLLPLDDRRRWYRYHQLFADVLHARLLDEQPERVADLHRRASGWFERTGDASEAIRHALAAGDFPRAADLAELAIPAMGRTRQESVVLGWLAALPDEEVRVRPVLTVGFAGALLLGGRTDGVAERLTHAESLLSGAAQAEGSADPAAGFVVADRARLADLPGMIELYRSALALAGGDVPGTVAHAQRARERSAADDHLCRTAALGLSGLALWSSGELEAGHRAYVECMAGLYRGGHIADTFGCALALADIRVTQGRLTDALRTYEQALHRGSAPGGSVLRGTADMYVGMSEIACERDDLPAAEAHLRRSRELGENTGLPQHPYRSRVAVARIRRARGDLAGAVDLLDQAQRLYNGDLFPDVHPVPALMARMWVLQGAIDRAFGWAAERGLAADDEVSYLREFEHITLARILLARHAEERAEERTEERTEVTLEQAEVLLGRLLAAADAGSRTGSVIELLVLQAVAQHQRGDHPTALASLDRALGLAEPEGYVRIFVDEGPAMATLLRVAARRGEHRGYARRLFGATMATGHEDKRADAAGRPLVSSLSDRELDVLRLLGTDLDGPGIARHLFVSLNTVRSHTKSIYAKLDVNNRRAAVRRARDDRLL